jgi:ubiquinone/menaquinone biosynthesis C-methylase UbiE
MLHSQPGDDAVDRVIARELMDDDEVVDEPVWRHTFHELAKVNRLLGGWSALRFEIDRMPDAPRRVLDVGAGGADLSVRLLDYLEARGVQARCVGLDRSEPALAAAAARYPERGELELVRGDARRLAFADGSFDLAMMNLALHHLDGDDAVAALRELARVGKYAIVNDLRRSVLGWALARVAFPLFTRNPLVRNDGPLSVRRAYTPVELASLARAAGWRSVRVRTHPWFRMTLAGGLA